MALKIRKINKKQSIKKGGSVNKGPKIGYGACSCATWAGASIEK